MADRFADHFDVLAAPRAALPWILETFRGQLERIDGGPRECAGQQKRALGRIVHTGAGAAAIIVPRGYPDDFAGWAVELNGALAFAYVRLDLRRQGLGSRLLCELPLRLPLSCAYWTDSAEAMACGGFPIHYDIHAYRALLAFVRGPRDFTPTPITERPAA